MGRSLVSTIGGLGLILIQGASAIAQGGGSNSLAQLSGSIRALAHRTAPAVVEVATSGYALAEDAVKTPHEVSPHHFTGSGVIVDSSGYIMTNAHVVQGATSIEITLGPLVEDPEPDIDSSEPPRTFVARVAGIDRDMDLALLKIEADGLQALSFADSARVAQGDVVLAIGSPVSLRNSLSIGVVSATSRSLGDDDPVPYIQTDASINPGNSGGALIDTDGNLVGLTTSLVSQSGGNEGIAFAIPSNIVRAVYQELRANGTMMHGSIGVFVQNISPSLARGLSLPTRKGVLVVDIEGGSSGEASGLKRRDIILSIDEEPVRTARQFNQNVLWREAGNKLTLTVQRGEERLSIPIVVSVIPDREDPLTIPDPPSKSLITRLGIFCLEIDQPLNMLIPNLRKQYGLVVVALMAGSSTSSSADLRPGDVIHSLNDLPIASLDVFRERIDELLKGDSVALQIERDGRFRYAALDLK